MKSRNIFVIAVCAVGLSGCLATNQDKGALIGAGAGGLLGSQIGSGTGKLVATGAGVLLGTMTGSAVGQSMDQQQQAPQVIVQQPQPVPVHPQYQSYPADACSRYIGNEGAYASCQRGVAQRNAEIQQQLEREAYQAGKGR